MYVSYVASSMYVLYLASFTQLYNCEIHLVCCGALITGHIVRKRPRMIIYD